MTNEHDPNSEIEDAYDIMVDTYFSKVQSTIPGARVVRDRDGNPVYTIPEGFDVGDNTLRSQCTIGACGQYVGNITAHLEACHPRVVQARNQRTLGVGGIARKVIAPILVAGAFLSGCSNLKEGDFDNARWRRFDNSNGRIWSCYMFEDIPHNQDSWRLYEFKVRQKNDGRLEGEIYLPDLDQNGIVGKY